MEPMEPLELKDAVAVVTGANRGLGRQLATQLVERGAKVYGRPAAPRRWTCRASSPCGWM